MNHQIFLSAVFDRDSGTREVVRSYFNKSYDDFYDYLEDVLKTFDPDHAISLGKHLYKCDFSIPQYSKGKRGSYRIIVALIYQKTLLIPVKIYKKAKIESVAKDPLVKILEKIVQEISLRP